MLTEAVKKVLAENLQANGGKIAISAYNATSLEGYQSRAQQNMSLPGNWSKLLRKQ